MHKRMGTIKRHRTPTAARRKLIIAKRRTRISGKERGTKNYVLEAHPELEV
jgi:hypothetical protein